MRDFNATELTYLQSRTGFNAKSMLWVSARNRSTNAIETVGLWTGGQTQDFVIGGVTRTYFAAGGMLAIDQITMQVGLQVRMQRVTLSPLASEVTQMMRQFDAGLAPAEIHRAMFDTLTGGLIAEPRRVWKGQIDVAPIHTAEIGGQSTVEVTLTSASRALTKGLTLTKSDAVQRLRGGDRGRRYTDLTGKVRDVWGEVLK